MKKACPNCGLLKLFSQFLGSKKTVDGLSWQCRGCEQVRIAAWRRTERGAQLTAEAKKRRRLENLERARQDEAKWRDSRKDKTADYIKENAPRLNAKKKADTASLCDRYVKQSLGYRASEDVPPELLEAKRLQLSITRFVRSNK